MAAAASDFHLLINARAREGNYQVRLYSVPIVMAVNFEDHWSYLKNTPPTTLDSRLLTTIAPVQVESEDEIEQGVPRYSSTQIDFLADPALAIVVQAMRDVTKNIWVEIVLTQNINDAPTRPPGGWQTINHSLVWVETSSMVWPTKDKLVFWGMIDRKSCKGKVNDQLLFGPDLLIGQTNVHDGTLALVFQHWITWSNWTNIKALLDWASNINFGLSNGAWSGSAAQMLASLMANLCPTQNFYISDGKGNTSFYSAGNRFINPFDNDNTFWGKLPIILESSDGTQTTMLSKVFVANNAALFLFNESVQTHSLTSDQSAPSLYYWNDLAQAITEWCREFFLNWQVELPTLANAGTVNFNTVDPFIGSARFLVTSIFDAPLTIAVKPLQGTIEYDPCGAWATSYTVNQPTAQDLLPNPQSVANGPFHGGSDESYTTLLAFVGESYVNGILQNDQRGWEIYVYNASHSLAFATKAFDAAGQVFTQWSALHAYLKIGRWGAPAAIVTVTSKGVGLETWGQSATVNGNPITPPKLTYGLYDWSDFPLLRGAMMLPGILSTPGDVILNATPGYSISPLVNKKKFSTISVKRTPNGDTELKLIEFAQLGSQITSSGSLVPPVAPPPPPPPNKGGPPDGGTPGVTGV